MRRLFPIGLVLLILFEAATVFFIMPLPGSQRIRSLSAAYLIYQWRWPARIAVGLILAAGTAALWRAGRNRWQVPAGLLVAGAVAWVINFRMAADRMFLPPTVVSMVPAASNTVPLDRLVVGVEVEGQTRAYPLQFIGYHHQVRDTIAGRPILVSYCTVCRTGRVFRPEVGGRVETFRLVGMDHFNAMFEDRTTGSWWRQANGEAVIGPLKGTALTEFPSHQVTLALWLSLYPHSLVMQADPAFTNEYAKDYAFENGTSRSALTGTDPRSWQDKSWVVGIAADGKSRAYDWNRLGLEGVINDVVGRTPIVLAVASDGASFFAFVRPDTATRFSLLADSLRGPNGAYALNGRGPAGKLVPINASQEFWHSWRTFHPETDRY